MKTAGCLPEVVDVALTPDVGVAILSVAVGVTCVDTTIGCSPEVAEGADCGAGMAG
jgi:hypothetical protein